MTNGNCVMRISCLCTFFNVFGKKFMYFLRESGGCWKQTVHTESTYSLRFWGAASRLRSYGMWHKCFYGSFVTMYDELQTIWKEAVVAEGGTIQASGGTTENRKKPHDLAWGGTILACLEGMRKPVENLMIWPKKVRSRHMAGGTKENREKPHNLA